MQRGAFFLNICSNYKRARTLQQGEKSLKMRPWHGITLSISMPPETLYLFCRKSCYRQTDKHRGFEQPFGCFERSRLLGLIVESSFTLQYFQVDFQADFQVDFQVYFFSIF